MRTLLAALCVLVLAPDPVAAQSHSAGAGARGATDTNPSRPQPNGPTAPAPRPDLPGPDVYVPSPYGGKDQTWPPTSNAQLEECKGGASSYNDTVLNTGGVDHFIDNDTMAPDPLTDLNTAALSAFGILSTKLDTVLFDQTPGYVGSPLHFAAPWHTGLADVVVLGPPATPGGDGNPNTFRRVRFTPGQAVSLMDMQRLEDFGELQAALLGLTLEMGNVNYNHSYVSISGGCMATFRQNLYSEPGHNFVAGEFVIDVD